MNIKYTSSAILHSLGHQLLIAICVGEECYCGGFILCNSLVSLSVETL